MHVKNNRWGKGLLSAGVLLSMTLSGCSQNTAQIEAQTQEVSIPVILIVDSSTGIKNEEALIERFNEMYDGKWQADVQWIMETEEEYRQNLKRQNVTDTCRRSLRTCVCFRHFII